METSNKTLFKNAGYYLPQKPPMMLVDRVISSNIESYIVTEKYVSSTDSYLKGHFPNHPVVPETVLLEMMLQSCGVLLTLINKKENGDGVEPGLGHVVKLKSSLFIHEVKPKDVVRFECSLKSSFLNFTDFSVVAKVNDRIVSKAEFVLAV